MGKSLFKCESPATNWLTVACRQPSWWAEPTAFSSLSFLSVVAQICQPQILLLPGEALLRLFSSQRP